MRIRLFWLFGWLAWFYLPLAVQSPDEEAIRQVLQQQANAWNEGRLSAFMQSYEDSPETVYVGKEVVRGYSNILARYQWNYPDRPRMGQLRFSDLEVRLLNESVATVIGRFQLTRPEAAGGPASGIFTLVLRKGPSGWKILHDHTS